MIFVRKAKFIDADSHPGAPHAFRQMGHPLMALAYSALSVGYKIANKIWESDVYRCDHCDVRTNKIRRRSK